MVDDKSMSIKNNVVSSTLLTLRVMMTDYELHLRRMDYLFDFIVGINRELKTSWNEVGEFSPSK
jgi:hypothetical protein